MQDQKSSEYFAHPSAIIDAPCTIGSGTKIWHFSHVCQDVTIGKNCNFGQNTMVAPGVQIGSNVKVQNNVSIYSGTIIEDDVFLGPSCVLTNISNPRSQVNRRSLYEVTTIRKGATIGANATIVCGIEIGKYAFIAAGTVVTKSVPDYGFMVGVPGKQMGWMSRHGHKLVPTGDKKFICPESNFLYQLENDVMKCISLNESDSLPESLATGTKSYRDFKANIE